jgi:hypothetical protein
VPFIFSEEIMNERRVEETIRKGKNKILDFT